MLGLPRQCQWQLCVSQVYENKKTPHGGRSTFDFGNENENVGICRHEQIVRQVRCSFLLHWYHGGGLHQFAICTKMLWEKKWSSSESTMSL